MKTIIETPTFEKQAAKIWDENERLSFVTWIALNPLAGDVIPGAMALEKLGGLPIMVVSVVALE